MVIAYHLILTVYGFWLPNDPRGSWSTWIRQWELLRFGEATKTDTRSSVAHRPHDRIQREHAKRALHYPPVHLSGDQARSVAMGFARAAKESGYVIHACSILEEHCHLVVARTDRKIEQIAAHLKGRASQQLRADGLHPMSSFEREDGSVPSVWAEGIWKVFIDDAEHLRHAIEYVESNPVREGKAGQSWKFVRKLM